MKFKLINTGIVAFGFPGWSLKIRAHYSPLHQGSG